MSCNDNNSSDCADVPCNNETTLTPVSSGCGCGCVSGCSSGCGGSAATPTPYYNKASGIEECHQKTIVQNQYVTGVSIANTFNMPICGGTAAAVIPGLIQISIGAYAWNPVFGYLEVVAFDYANSTIILKNNCEDNNAAPGTSIPSCTLFTIVDPPIGADSPCNNAAVPDGAIIVCHDGTQSVLTATTAGMVPVATGTDNNFESQLIDIPAKVCTELTADLILFPAFVGPYLITVADTNIFQTNDLVVFGNSPLILVVNGIIDSNTFTASLLAPVAGVVTFTAGTMTCLAPCCEQVGFWADNPCMWDLTSRFALGIGTYQGVHDGSLVSLETGQEYTGGVANATIVNSSCRSAVIHVNCEFDLICQLFSDGSDAGYVQTLFTPKVGYSIAPVGTAPAPVAGSIDNFYDMVALNPYTDPAGQWYKTFNVSFAQNYTVPSGSEIKLTVESTIKNVAEAMSGLGVHAICIFQDATSISNIMKVLQIAY
jgi:hypothetical protein